MSEFFTGQRIFLTGASGMLGSALAERLRAAGAHLVCPSRRALPWASAPACQVIPCSALEEVKDFRPWLAGCTAVVHAAARVHVMRDQAADPDAAFHALNVALTTRLAEQAQESGVGRFVFISSVKAIGERSAPGQPFDERTPCRPEDAYGRSKHAAEQALQRLAQAAPPTQAMSITVVRPPLVYGPGVRANFAQMLRVVQGGWPLPLASIENRRSLVYLGNLVAFLLHVLKDPRAANQTFMVADESPLSTPALLRAIAAAAGQADRLWPCPPPVLRAAAGLLGRADQIARLTESLEVCQDKACRMLDWQPPYTLAQGLAATLASSSSSRVS